MIFQGQEMLEDGFWSDTDPIDWTKATTYAGIVSMYRDMIRLRRNWYNNTRGLRGNGCNVHHVNNTSKVIGFHRWESGGAGDDVVVIANFGNTTYTSYNLGFPRAGTWYVRFNSDWNGYDSGFANTNSYNTTANSGAKDPTPPSPSPLHPPKPPPMGPPPHLPAYPQARHPTSAPAPTASHLTHNSIIRRTTQPPLLERPPRHFLVVWFLSSALSCDRVLILTPPSPPVNTVNTVPVSTLPPYPRPSPSCAPTPPPPLPHYPTTPLPHYPTSSTK